MTLFDWSQWNSFSALILSNNNILLKNVNYLWAGKKFYNHNPDLCHVFSVSPTSSFATLQYHQVIKLNQNLSHNPKIKSTRVAPLDIFRGKDQIIDSTTSRLCLSFVSEYTPRVKFPSCMARCSSRTTECPSTEKLFLKGMNIHVLMKTVNKPYLM